MSASFMIGFLIWREHDTAFHKFRVLMRYRER
jgi:hypothetical protein